MLSWIDGFSEEERQPCLEPPGSGTLALWVSLDLGTVGVLWQVQLQQCPVVGPSVVGKQRGRAGH